MISSNSRYRDSRTALIASSRGSNVTVVPSPAREWSFNFTYYTFTGHDRIDLLARRIYGDANRWWMIADANPEILDWTDVPVGTVLRVPSLV